MEHLERADVGIAVVTVIKGKSRGRSGRCSFITVGKLTSVQPWSRFMFDSLATGMDVGGSWRGVQFCKIVFFLQFSDKSFGIGFRLILKLSHATVLQSMDNLHLFSGLPYVWPRIRGWNFHSKLNSPFIQLSHFKEVNVTIFPGSCKGGMWIADFGGIMITEH